MICNAKLAFLCMLGQLNYVIKLERNVPVPIEMLLQDNITNLSFMGPPYFRVGLKSFCYMVSRFQLVELTITKQKQLISF